VKGEEEGEEEVEKEEGKDKCRRAHTANRPRKKKEKNM
jgi:hypothetical protein